VNRVNVGATIEQQRHHIDRSADGRAVQRMTAGAVDIVNERWLLIEEGAYARELAGFGGVMDWISSGAVDGTSRRDRSVMCAASYSCRPFQVSCDTGPCRASRSGNNAAVVTTSDGRVPDIACTPHRNAARGRSLPDGWRRNAVRPVPRELNWSTLQGQKSGSVLTPSKENSPVYPRRAVPTPDLP
jgi:hypothetical protein